MGKSYIYFILNLLIKILFKIFLSDMVLIYYIRVLSTVCTFRNIISSKGIPKEADNERFRGENESFAYAQARRQAVGR
jgi:hypothetical protein